MAGLDAQIINATFLIKGSDWRVNMPVNPGYSDSSKLHSRLPRLDFDDACRFS
ncbi:MULTISPECIES: hypothetical protein [unclassified Tatumella]|nr:MULTISPECIES: hypothetical protein [unclassified Tatumella]MBS0876169.1 hypothetical protein [Tatumella sp. JGM82]